MQDQATRALRILVITEWLLVLAAVPVELYLETKLPPALREQIASQDESLSAYALTLWVAFLGAWIVGTVGLYRLWRPARLIYTVATIASILMMPTLGHLILHAWSAPLSYATSVVPGSILSLLYFSQASLHFASADGVPVT